MVLYKKIIIIIGLVISYSCCALSSTIPENLIETESIFKPIPRKRLDKAWRNIQEQFKKHEKQPTEELTFISWYGGRFPELLEKSYKTLRDKKRIIALTDEIEHVLGLNERYCFDKKKSSKHRRCADFRAGYDFVNNYILVDPNLNKKLDFEKSLFHELIHHIQMTYRLPFDLKLLPSHIKSMELNLSDTHKKCNLDSGTTIYDDAKTIFSLNYEWIANWYTTTLFMDKRWFDFAKKESAVITWSLLERIKGSRLKEDETNFKSDIRDLAIDSEKPIYISNVDSSQPEFVFSSTDKLKAFFLRTPTAIISNQDTKAYENSDLHINLYYADRVLEEYAEKNCLYTHAKKQLFLYLIELQKVFETKIIYTSSETFSKCNETYEKIQNQNRSPFYNWLTIENLPIECNALTVEDKEKEIFQLIFQDIIDQLQPGGSGVDPGGSGIDPNLELFPGAGSLFPNLITKP